MCEMITMNNEESNEQMDVFVNTDQQLKDVRQYNNFLDAVGKGSGWK